MPVGTSGSCMHTAQQGHYSLTTRVVSGFQPLHDKLTQLQAWSLHVAHE